MTPSYVTWFEARNSQHATTLEMRESKMNVVSGTGNIVLHETEKVPTVIGHDILLICATNVVQKHLDYIMEKHMNGNVGKRNIVVSTVGRTEDEIAEALRVAFES